MTPQVGAFPPPNGLMVIVHLCALQVSILGACRSSEDAEVAPPGVKKWPLLYLLAVPHS